MMVRDAKKFDDYFQFVKAWLLSVICKTRCPWGDIIHSCCTCGESYSAVAYQDALAFYYDNECEACRSLSEDERVAVRCAKELERS